MNTYRLGNVEVVSHSGPLALINDLLKAPELDDCVVERGNVELNATDLSTDDDSSDLLMTITMTRH